MLLKPSELAHDDALARASSVCKLVDRRRVAAREDLLAERAGVLGIDVDLAAAQRVVHERRAAELGEVRRLVAAGADELRDHLAQDDRLGELLRRRRARRAASTPRGQAASDEQRQTTMIRRRAS